jgi:SSS family solute:Na+ symporter
MTDAQLNAGVIQEFEALEADPAGAEVLFPFDAEFAARQPALADRILAFNVQAAGMAAPSGKTVTERNVEVLKAAKEDSSKLTVKQQLVGYDYDGAFPLLIRYLTPKGLRGIVLAALMGAVISSLASMLNAASTIFTMDLYREYIDRNATQKQLVWVGRCCVVVFVAIGCFIAPQLANPKFQGAFAYIQEFQGYISPGVLSIFLFGLFVRWSPRMCGVIGLVLSPIVYGALHYFWGELAFLNRMAITVGVLVVVLGVITLLWPLKERVTLPTQTKIALESSGTAKVFGVVVVVATIALYVVFW